MYNIINLLITPITSMTWSQRNPATKQSPLFTCTNFGGLQGEDPATTSTAWWVQNDEDF